MPSTRRPHAVTITDVAREAGVAASTVSRALTNPDRVNVVTREHVQQVAARLGYRASPAARALGTGRTATLALVLPDITNPYFSGLIRGAERQAEATGHILVIGDSEENARAEARMVERLAPGVDGFLLGSNYIWGWEMNRVARDLIADAGGKVLGERYLRIGETDVSRLIDEIRVTRPNFILNNLIGTSSYAFLAAYRELGREDAAFKPDSCPVISCNLTEGELPAIGETGKGHLSAGPYFAPRPAAFASSFEASAYASVQVMADVLSGNPDAGPAEFSKAFAERRFATRLGPIAIDPNTQHATLPVLIGRIADGFFEVVSREEEVAPDPYLSRYDPAKTFGRPRLRVVS